MTGIAKPRRRYGKRIKDGEKDDKQIYSMLRRSEAPTQSQSAILAGASGGSNAGSTAGNFLPTAGGTMIGPIAFFDKLITLENGEFSVANTTDTFSSRVIVTPQTGSTDNLVTITGAGWAGQILFIQGVATDTLTVIDGKSNQTNWATSTSYSLDDIIDNGGNVYVCKSAHTSGDTDDEPGVGATWETYWFKGNIETIDGADFSIADDDIILFMYDITDAKWQQVTTGKQTSMGAGASFPLAYTINDQGSKGSGDSPLDHDTSAVTGHKLKFTITGDLTLTFSGLPASGTAMDWYVEVTQDGTGGHTVTWPAAVTPAITLSETADTTSLVALHTDDNGTIIRAVTLLNAVGTIGDNLGNHIATTDLEMSSHTINFNNDIQMLSAANSAADGFLELKVDSADFFDFTESNNGVVGIKLRSQHATNPDNTLTLTQFSGTTGQAELFSPNRFHFFGSGSSEVFNFDQNRIETLVNILPDADGTINLGNSTSLRYAGVHAATFKFDTNRKLDFNTGGGSITVNGSLDSFILTVDSVQKLSSSASLTTLSGNVDITGIAGVGDKAEFTEITAPGADPSANTGWLYGKLVSGHTEPFWEDEDGTVTNLIGGGGGSVNQISQGDSSVTVSDTGTGSIVGKVDNVQKFNISPTSFNIDDSVVLGLLGSDTVTFNADVASDILPSSDNAHDLGASGAEWKDLYIDGIADIDRLENNGASVAVGDDLKFDFGDTVNFNASQSSTGSAGLADALPSKPTGYVIIKITDTEYVVPYYAKS